MEMVAGRGKKGREGDSLPSKEASEQNRFVGYMSGAGPMGMRLSGTTKDGILLVFGIIVLSPRLLLFG